MTIYTAKQQKLYWCSDTWNICANNLFGKTSFHFNLHILAYIIRFDNVYIISSAIGPKYE